MGPSDVGMLSAGFKDISRPSMRSGKCDAPVGCSSDYCLAEFSEVTRNAGSVRANTGHLVLGSGQIVQLAMFRNVQTLEVDLVLTYFVHAIASVLSSHLSVGFLVHRAGLVLPVLVSGFSAFGQGVIGMSHLWCACVQLAVNPAGLFEFRGWSS